MFTALRSAHSPRRRGEGRRSCNSGSARDHVYSLGDEYDVLIAFNEDAYALHGPDLARGGVLVIDGDPSNPAQSRHPELSDKIVYHIPMERIAKQEVGELKAKNMVAVGAAAALFGFSKEIIEKNMTERFGKRGEKMLADNMKGFKAGYDYATTQIKKTDPFKLKEEKGDGFLVLSGNEAIALGALYAGCRFVASYPITPASEIMEIMANELPRVGGAMYQAEDEIASMGMILGGAFGGVRSMTSTSGPGLLAHGGADRLGLDRRGPLRDCGCAARRPEHRASRRRPSRPT